MMTIILFLESSTFLKKKKKKLRYVSKKVKVDNRKCKGGTEKVSTKKKRKSGPV